MKLFASTPISLVFRNGLNVIELRSDSTPSLFLYFTFTRCSGLRLRPFPSSAVSMPQYFHSDDGYLAFDMSISETITPAIAGPIPRMCFRYSA